MAQLFEKGKLIQIQNPVDICIPVQQYNMRPNVTPRPRHPLFIDCRPPTFNPAVNLAAYVTNQYATNFGTDHVTHRITASFQRAVLLL